MRRSNPSSSGGPAVKVTVYDPARGESISLTCYPPPGTRPRDVAELCQAALRSRWQTTDIRDRRHKPRSL